MAGEQKKPNKVYFVVAPSIGRVKIGLSNNPANRFAEIKACSPVAVELLVSVDGGQELENDLHHHFAAQRVHGEWFVFSSEIATLVAALRRGEPIPAIPPAPYRHVRAGLWKGYGNCRGEARVPV